jgi:hypothetical protein
MPTDFTKENVKSWVLRTLADYDGRLTLDGDTFAREAIWILGPRRSFMVSREATAVGGAGVLRRET